MRFFGRAALSVLVLWGATGAFVSCSSDPDSGGEDPPRTVDDTLQVTSTGATSLAVLANDQDLDNEPLTVTIEDSPFVGSASVNSDRTVRLDMPSGFRGVTRFRYKVTNSLGGFSTSTAVVFVDVPAYRVIFPGRSSSQSPEIFVTNLISQTQISQATSGNLRLQKAWRSTSGGIVAYQRADPAQVASTTEFFFVKTKPVASPVRINRPSGRNFVSGGPVTISDDDRWIAFPTSPSGTSGQATNLYAYDTSSSSSPVLVDLSANVLANLTVWGGTQPALYYMARPGSAGPAVYKATTGDFGSPQRVSPTYAVADTHDRLLVSPDQTKIVVIGKHGGRNGAFLIDPANPNTEQRLTTDMPVDAVIESFEINSDYTQLTYLWRAGSVATARLSTVPVNATGTTPTTVIEGNITSFSERRPAGNTALITSGSGGAGADGTLFEVSLDNSAADVRIASNVSGGFYDDTGDRVFLFSDTRTPSVINRSDFDRDTSFLVRSSTPAQALYALPIEERSVALVEDPSSGFVLVNASAPGRAFRLTTLEVGSLSSTLFPGVIDASP